MIKNKTKQNIIKIINNKTKQKIITKIKSRQNKKIITTSIHRQQNKISLLIMSRKYPDKKKAQTKAPKKKTKGALITRGAARARGA